MDRSRPGLGGPEYILALDAFHLGYRAALRILGNCFGLDASISMPPRSF